MLFFIPNYLIKFKNILFYLIKFYLITSLKELTNNGNIDAMLTFLEQN